MARTTAQQDLEWRAKYKVGETVQVYNIFDGWQDCTIKKLVWDHMYGRVEYHVVPVLKPNSNGWITNETAMKSSEQK
jgi:hypothetical protein